MTKRKKELAKPKKQTKELAKPKEKGKELAQPNDNSVDSNERLERAKNIFVTLHTNEYVKGLKDTDKLSEEEKAKEIEDLKSGFGRFLKTVENPEILKIMLSSQMMLIHEQFLNIERRLGKEMPMNFHQNYLNTLTKLSNVFIQQVSLMQKLTGRGEQRVVVEHLNIEPGSQVVVGNVTKGGGG